MQSSKNSKIEVPIQEFDNNNNKSTLEKINVSVLKKFMLRNRRSQKERVIFMLRNIHS